MLLDRVAIRPIPGETETASGLVIPDQAQEKPQKGIVVSAGPGREHEPMMLKEGETVLYEKHAGTLVKVDGEEILMMRQTNIFCKL